MSGPVMWKPELWRSLNLEPVDLDPKPTGTWLDTVDSPHSFFPPQPIEECYELRGILPRAHIEFKDQD